MYITVYVMITFMETSVDVRQKNVQVLPKSLEL